MNYVYFPCLVLMNTKQGEVHEGLDKNHVEERGWILIGKTTSILLTGSKGKSYTGLYLLIDS